MVLISKNLRRVEEEEYTAEDDATKDETEVEPMQVGDVVSDDEMNDKDEDGEDDDEDGEDDDEDGKDDDGEDGKGDDDEKSDDVQIGEAISDDVALQILEEELDEIEELEQLLTTPEQESETFQDAEDDDLNWVTQDDQVLSQPYEIPTDDDLLLEHEAIGDDGVAPSTDIKTVSLHKNSTYIIIVIALVFGIGLYKFCVRSGKKERRRHVAHKRLNMDDDFTA